jgi:hypothetical protein
MCDGVCVCEAIITLKAKPIHIQTCCEDPSRLKFWDRNKILFIIRVTMQFDTGRTLRQDVLRFQEAGIWERRLICQGNESSNDKIKSKAHWTSFRVSRHSFYEFGRMWFQISARREIIQTEGFRNFLQRLQTSGQYYKLRHGRLLSNCFCSISIILSLDATYMMCLQGH